jgi:hypothetical protein
MKTISTKQKALAKRWRWLLLIIPAVAVVFGCYEFRVVDQPTEANSNSTFDVYIVMNQDDDPDNNFVNEGDDTEDIGLLGVFLPEGWTVKDSIHYYVQAQMEMEGSDNQMHTATKDWSNDGYLIYDEDHSAAMEASALGAPGSGYYWWGAKSNKDVDLHFFDSLYFTITIITDDQEGNFALRYAVGDEDSNNRIPYDPNNVTDPMPITITEAVSSRPPVINESAVSLYPNPSYGIVHLDFEKSIDENVEMFIYDMRGRTILNKALEYQENTLDVSAFSAGTYMMRLTAGEDVITKKFVVY